MAEAAAPAPAALPAGEYPPLRGTALVLLTIAIGVSSFMEILDMTIVNVSLPAIAGSLAPPRPKRSRGLAGPAGQPDQVLTTRISSTAS